MFSIPLPAAEWNEAFPVVDGTTFLGLVTRERVHALMRSRNAQVKRERSRARPARLYRFAAARFGGKRAGTATRAAEAYEAYLGGLDGELARLWEALPPPRLLALASAYGVAAPEGALRVIR